MNYFTLKDHSNQNATIFLPEEELEETEVEETQE